MYVCNGMYERMNLDMCAHLQTIQELSAQLKALDAAASAMSAEEAFAATHTVQKLLIACHERTATLQPHPEIESFVAACSSLLRSNIANMPATALMQLQLKLHASSDEAVRSAALAPIAT